MCVRTVIGEESYEECNQDREQKCKHKPDRRGALFPAGLRERADVGRDDARAPMQAHESVAAVFARVHGIAARTFV